MSPSTSRSSSRRFKHLVDIRRACCGRRWRSRISSATTGRMAASQCRPRESWAAQGHGSDRALPHGGAGRARRALQGLRLYRHRLQFLSQPALPQVPGRGGKAMDGRTRGRAVAGSLLPRRVHVAGANRRLRLSEQGNDLRHRVQGGGRDGDDSRCRPQASRRQRRHHRGAAHLGLGNDASPATSI